MKDFKNISIVAYLDSIGFQPVKQVNNQFLYFSPINSENSPSFYVEPNKNVFFDWSNGLKGDIIDLVQAIEKLSFKNALNRVSDLSVKTSFSFSGNKQFSIPKNQITITNVISIQHPNLIHYIQKRDIDLDLARLFLSEIHYINNNRNYYSLGFKNDSGGYELRNGLGFKAKTSNAITTFETNSKSLTIFEGFFDFLSALQYYKLTKPNNFSIVLNSLSNTNSILKIVQNFQVVNLFLDNDKAGFENVKKIQNFTQKAINKSLELYPNFKDFNDFLTSNSK